MPVSLATSGTVSEALRLIELDPGSSLADDNPASAAASEQYPLALDECLELGDWSFASVLANLALANPLSTLAIDPDLPYLYIPPGDCVRVQSVGDDWTKWRLDAAGLRASDGAPLTIRYTARITNEGRMPATFRFFVSLALAIRLAPYFQTNIQKLEQLRDLHRNQKALALRQDARNASQARYDNLSNPEDWVDEAIR